MGLEKAKKHPNRSKKTSKQKQNNRNKNVDTSVSEPAFPNQRFRTRSEYSFYHSKKNIQIVSIYERRCSRRNKTDSKYAEKEQYCQKDPIRSYIEDLVQRRSRIESYANSVFTMMWCALCYHKNILELRWMWWWHVRNSRPHRHFSWLFDGLIQFLLVCIFRMLCICFHSVLTRIVP